MPLEPSARPPTDTRFVSSRLFHKLASVREQISSRTKTASTRRSGTPGPIRELTGKTNLAKRQLTDLKISKANALKDERDGNDRLAVGNRRGETSSRTMSDEDVIDEYEKNEARTRLLGVGNVAEKSTEPLPPREI